MKKLLRLTWFLLLCFACGGVAEDTEQTEVGELLQPLCSGSTPSTIKGQLKYIRHIPTDCDNNSRIKCTDNGLALPVPPGVMMAFDPATSQRYVGEITTTGNYLVCVPGGTAQYSLFMLNRSNDDLGQGTAANWVGTNTLWALVQNFGLPMFGVEDVFAQGVTVPVAGTTTVATNPFIVSSNPANHAQAVDLIRIQYNTWVSSYGAGPILSPAGAPLRIRSKPFVSGVDPAATGSALCRVRNNPPLGSSDCYVSNVVSMTLHSLTAWHETGHGFNALISLRKSSKVRPYDATMGCVGSSHNNNEGMSLEEGLADWYETATRWSTGNIPQGNNGVHCNNFQYAPLSFTSAPPAPACGTGAIPNSEFHVEKGLLELIDANTIPNEAGCRNEQVQISPGVILDALSRFTTTTSSASCPGNSPGLEEGGLSEGSFCSPSTPNWPYTGTNALQVVDQTSFLDLLAILKNQFGVSGSGLFDVWANTGFERGDSATQLP